MATDHVALRHKWADEGTVGFNDNPTRTFVVMSEIPMMWQVIIQLAVPVITATATIIAVFITSHRADIRRRKDQKDADLRRKADQAEAEKIRLTDQRAEDQRRQEDFAERENERQRQLTAEANERQLQATATYLSEVRRARSEELKAVFALAKKDIVDDEKYALNYSIHQTDRAQSFANLQHRLHSSWEMLYLSISHPEIQPIVRKIYVQIDDFDQQVRNYGRAVYELLDEIRENLPHPPDKVLNDIPAPSLSKQFDRLLLDLLGTSRRKLNPYSPSKDH